MRIVFDPLQRDHAPPNEFHRGKSVPYFESPERVDAILAELEQDPIWEVVQPEDFSIEILNQVHDGDYVSFLQTAWEQWANADSGEAKPHVWPSQAMRAQLPESIYGKLGYYSFDATCGITSTTWPSAWASVKSAATAAEFAWNNQSNSFALCRPPGHHAERKAFGGYCYLNSAAVAAQRLIELGAKRVALLDVDYHHGNGTQDIFYDRADVLVASLHADPSIAYPYFAGYASETGVGEGAGFNLNVPLPERCDWPMYETKLCQTLKRIHENAPDGLVVSFGADTYFDDPLGTFRLKSHHIERMSKLIASTDLPTVIVLEGGYAIDALGTNVVSFLKPFG